MRSVNLEISQGDIDPFDCPDVIMDGHLFENMPALKDAVGMQREIRHFVDAHPDVYRVNLYVSAETIVSVAAAIQAVHRLVNMDIGVSVYYLDPKTKKYIPHHLYSGLVNWDGEEA